MWGSKGHDWVHVSTAKVERRGEERRCSAVLCYVMIGGGSRVCPGGIGEVEAGLEGGIRGINGSSYVGN